MIVDDDRLDEAVCRADPMGDEDLEGADRSPEARRAHARIVAAPHRARGRAVRARRIAGGAVLVAGIGALMAALIVAVPGDPDRPASPSAPPRGGLSEPPSGPAPGEPDPGGRPRGREAVDHAPPGERSAAGISLLDRAGLARADVPAPLLRGDYCQVYADRVHRIAAVPGGGAVYLAWGPGDQVTWVTLGARRGDGGGCSPGAEVRRREAIVLAPGVGPTLFGPDPRSRPRPPLPPRYFVGFVRDGYASVEALGVRAPVRGNVFVLRTAPRRRVAFTFRGPAGVHRETIEYR